MSDELKANLRGIFREWLSEYCYSEDKALELIDQAYKDAGYDHSTIIDGMSITVGKRKLMTGQEWYERFKKELPPPLHTPVIGGPGMVYWPTGTVYNAAKRAAGLE